MVLHLLIDIKSMHLCNPIYDLDNGFSGDILR